VVDKALGGVKPHLMMTDAPYGVEYDAAWRNESGRPASGKVIKPIGSRAIDKVLNDDRADWRDAWSLFPGDVAYVWHGAMMVTESRDALASAGFEMRAQIVWAKNNFAISRGHYHFKHEPCWYAVRKGSTGHWRGGHN
jgi:DNA modification methylase